MGIDVQEYKNRYGRKPGTSSFAVRVTNINAFEESMDALAADVQKAVRPSAQAGAQVLYDEMRRNVDALVGDTKAARGQLKASIYQVYSRSNSTAMKAAYHVSWNHIKAPHGHLIENGHWMPYVTYRDKRTGELHTAVKPSRLKEYLAKYRGKTVPKQLRDYFFIRRPSPKWIAARPFVRHTLSKADVAGKKAAEVMWNAINGQMRLPL